MEERYFLDSISIGNLNRANQFSDKEAAEKHLVSIFDKIVEDFSKTNKIIFFQISFSFLFSTSSFNGYFGFLRKTTDAFIEAFDGKDNELQFLVKESTNTSLLLMLQYFFKDFAVFMSLKVRLQLFQYNLTKFYMARDAAKPDQMLAILAILYPISKNLEDKIINGNKVFSLMDKLLFSEESEYSPIMKNTLSFLFVSLTKKRSEIRTDVICFCVV